MRPDMAFADDEMIATLGLAAKEDAKLLQHHNRSEAMILFRFWRKCCRELSARAIARCWMEAGIGYRLN